MIHVTVIIQTAFHYYISPLTLRWLTEAGGRKPEDDTTGDRPVRLGEGKWELIRSLHLWVEYRRQPVIFSLQNVAGFVCVCVCVFRCVCVCVYAASKYRV